MNNYNRTGLGNPRVGFKERQLERFFRNGLSSLEFCLNSLVFSSKTMAHHHYLCLRNPYLLGGDFLLREILELFGIEDNDEYRKNALYLYQAVLRCTPSP